jgi:hypothetical protein
MNISGNIQDGHGHYHYVNLWAPDPPQPQPVVIKGFDRHCHKLPQAGLWGFLIPAVIAVVAGLCWLFMILPRPIKTVVLLVLFGWIVWTCATYKATHEDRFSFDKVPAEFWALSSIMKAPAQHFSLNGPERNALSFRCTARLHERLPRFSPA